MIKKSDSVILRDPFWHQGHNLGGSLGIVIDDSSHLLVNILEYKGSPVKCFRNEVKKLVADENETIEDSPYDILWC